MSRVLVDADSSEDELGLNIPIEDEAVPENHVLLDSDSGADVQHECKRRRTVPSYPSVFHSGRCRERAAGGGLEAIGPGSVFASLLGGGWVVGGRAK